MSNTGIYHKGCGQESEYTTQETLHNQTMLHYRNAHMVLLVSIGNSEDKIIEDKIMDFKS